MRWHTCIIDAHHDAPLFCKPWRDASHHPDARASLLLIFGGVMRPPEAPLVARFGESPAPVAGKYCADSGLIDPRTLADLLDRGHLVGREVTSDPARAAVAVVRGVGVPPERTSMMPSWGYSIVNVNGG